MTFDDDSLLNVKTNLKPITNKDKLEIESDD